MCCAVLYCRYGINAFILFPKIADSLKSNYGEEAYNAEGLVPRALRMIKSKFPEAVVCTDVALDPYSSQVRVTTGTSAAFVFVLSFLFVDGFTTSINCSF